ncbi:hypothetical protein V8E53_013235 [Lactarius tabidus]
MDSNVVREQLASQMQISRSITAVWFLTQHSPSSTPFPGPQYNPWTFLQTSNAFGGGRRGGIVESAASMRSSPSHQPVPLSPLSRGNHGLRQRERSQDLRRREKFRPSPRVESWEHSSDPQRYAPRAAHCDESADDEDDEDVGGMEGVADDLLQLEFHTDYVGNPEKRRRRWKLRWEAHFRAFHALDREIDTTLVLLAAPSQTGKPHSVASRAVRCDSSLHESTGMVCIRSAFAEFAARRPTSHSSLPLE